MDPSTTEGLDNFHFEVTTSPTARDSHTYRREVRFNPPNKVLKSPNGKYRFNSETTPSKKGAFMGTQNSPNDNYNPIEASPSKKRADTIKRKKGIINLRGEAKTRKVSDNHKVPGTSHPAIGTQTGVSATPELRYVHQICGRAFSSLAIVYDHHAGTDGGADGSLGCWNRHSRPNIAWYVTNFASHHSSVDFPH
jgi:hypothetical protein